MLAANNIEPPLKTSIIYLEDKPLKIIKKLKSIDNRKGSNKRLVEKKTISKRTRKSRTTKLHMEESIKVKRESNMNHNDEQLEVEHINPNDPLLTPPQIKVKCELKTDKAEINTEYEEDIYLDSDNDKDYCVEEYEEEEDDEEEEYKFKGKRELYNNDSKDELVNKEGDDDNDEPFILLTKKRPSTYKKNKKKPRLHNCLETCKYKCTTKFNKQQRLDIFDYYWNLSTEEKVTFIRQHTRKPILAKVRIKKGRNNCCYFLKYYKINETTINKEPETETSSNNDDDLTKVCRKFFENTLGVSGLEIKQAIEGYELQKERIILPPKDVSRKNEYQLSEKSPKETQKTQQFLDPETGNLTDTKPKTKTKRRKPGEPLPERFPKPVNCDIRCRFKCHENFSEEERKKMCDIFWSLDFKRRKDFILARLEKNEVESVTTPEFRKSNRPVRSYQTKFYLRSSLNGENKRVCKHFIMNTLRINRHFIENAMEFADETTGFYTGTDRRGGTNPTTIKLSQERKKLVMDHINSYPCWLPNRKSKTKYLHHSLTIRKMYDAYKDKCLSEQKKFVSTCYYYTVFHNDFRLAFLSNPQQKKKVQLSNPNISHYTGDEAGGYWVDSKDNKLDLRLFNPAQTLSAFTQNSCADLTEDSSLVTNHSVSETAAHNLESHQPSSRPVNKSDLNPSLYEMFLKIP